MKANVFLHILDEEMMMVMMTVVMMMVMTVMMGARTCHSFGYLDTSLDNTEISAEILGRRPGGHEAQSAAVVAVPH